ncbi:MAG: flagellar hook-associated protein FlgL [Melioribacteraceae bacterium]|nr:flagellar hook-associated protein FlgL [Melioribacteraceae bacterium]MCF8355162.1 flagellar hook-associated protein FlgL [Melioribacteraceae bacterium]MCF8392491.1 flagellar hook-associated protein FlgL [Melioribacteraceae bacterium]MCF8418402.1 flagellar hook-associated protein FlgL [Melioribacteraceae bacterium]
MRVTDSLLQQSFLYNLKNAKNQVSKVQNQLTTLKKVNAPSDSPLGSSRIIKLNSQLNNLATYKSNIENGLSFAENTSLTIQNMQDEVSNVLIELTTIKNAANSGNLSEFADKFEYAINNLLELSNSEFNDQYVFGGNDNSTAPFSINDSTGMMEINSSAIGGNRKIRIANNTEQKINITGEELLVPELKSEGGLALSIPVGDSASDSMKVYDAEGNSYDLNITYTKTAANTFNGTFVITDSDSNEVFNETKELKFSNLSGILQDTDGSSANKFMVEIPDNKIQFQVNLNGLKETSGETSLGHAGNEEVNALNTLIAIKDSLRNGIKPNAKQFEIIDDFNSKLINKMSSVGNIINRLESSLEMTSSQEIEIQKLISNENDVDLAASMIELQNRQFTLDLSYKVSSMLLPKSLLDYL